MEFVVASDLCIQPVPPAVTQMRIIRSLERVGGYNAFAGLVSRWEAASAAASVSETKTNRRTSRSGGGGGGGGAGGGRYQRELKRETPFVSTSIYRHLFMMEDEFKPVRLHKYYETMKKANKRPTPAMMAELIRYDAHLRPNVLAPLTYDHDRMFFPLC